MGNFIFVVRKDVTRKRAEKTVKVKPVIVVKSKVVKTKPIVVVKSRAAIIKPIIVVKSKAIKTKPVIVVKTRAEPVKPDVAKPVYIKKALKATTPVEKALVKPVQASAPPQSVEKIPENQVETTSPAETVEKTRRHTDHWSDCGLVFYTAGKAYGVTNNLRSIYIGTEPEVQAFFDQGRLDDSLTKLQKDTLSTIKQIRKAEIARTIEEERTDGDNRDARGKVKKPRVLASKKRTLDGISRPLVRRLVRR